MIRKEYRKHARAARARVARAYPPTYTVLNPAGMAITAIMAIMAILAILARLASFI